MLGVGEDIEFRQPGGTESAYEGVDRAVAGRGERVEFFIESDFRFTSDDAVALSGLEVLEFDGRGAGEIFAMEDVVDFLRGELGAFGVRVVVDDFADLLVHEFRQGVAEGIFEHVSDAAFAGLAVDADDGFVTATEVGGVDRNVNNIPRGVRFLNGPRFFDGVLMRAAEGREDQLAGVGLAGRYFEAGAALVDIADAVDVGEVETGMNAVRVEVQCDGDDVEVARAFPVAEECALDAVGASEQGEFGGGDAGTAVVVGVQGDEREVAAGEVGGHPLDLIGMDVGRGVFNGGREIEDDLIFRGRLPAVGDGFAYLQGEIEFGAREALGRILKTHPGAGRDERGGVVLDPLRALNRDRDDIGARGVEDVLALGRRGGVIKVKDGVFRAAQGSDAADDELFAALAEDLNRDVIRDAVFLDETATEIEFDLGSRRETDLDFLEANFHEQLEVFEFLVDAHGLGEGLVAVAEIDAAPDRGAVESAVGPLAVGQVDGRERAVFTDGRGLHGTEIIIDIFVRTARTRPDNL